MTPNTPSSQTGRETTTLDELGITAEFIGTALSDTIDPIQFDNISKTYGDTTAVANATLTFPPGQCHCLAGPNGSGKTTIGRLAVGLTRPSTGEIHGPTDDIGYGFQSPRVYPSLTVTENITTFARSVGVSPSGEWVTAITNALRLNRVAHQRAEDLSGGFQKKLDLAIALLATPSFIWLDEPLGDLDDVSVDRVLELLRRYRDGGGGVIVTTHNFDVFNGMFDTLTVFYDGKQHATIELDNATDGTDLLTVYRETVAEMD